MEDKLSGCIREAIASEEYSKASQLWDGYAAQLLDRLARGTLTGAAMAEAGELVTWSRTALICARAHARNRLATLQVAGTYGSVPRQQECHLRASG